MMTLVTGGSKCGKSRYAESLFDGFSGRKFYAAAMIPYGSEAHAAISRHREARLGKGFTTIERYTDIGGIDIPPGSALLIECLSTLLANEMFGEEAVKDPADRIITGLTMLNERTEMLVAVVSETGSDGIEYPPETEMYRSLLAELSIRCGEMADNVVECVYGIPVALKGSV